MKDGLLQLLKLQAVDKELQALQEAGSRYPAEITQHQSELERIDEALQEQRDRLEELATQQRHLEHELESAGANLKVHEERFAEVTTNKQYDALQLEIEACKKRIAEEENQLLEVIEDAAQLREQLEVEAKEAETSRQGEQGLVAELQQKLATQQQEIDGVQAHRRSVTQSIEANLLQLYERSRKLRGTRVSPVRKGACGMCFRQLPAQQKSNVRRNERVHYCESCGAILVWDEESN